MTPKERSLKHTLKRFSAYLKTPDALRLLIYVVTVLLCLAMFLAAISPVRYDLRVGMVPTHTIAATKDVVDETTTERNRQAAAAAVTPTYQYQPSITDEVLLSLEQVFNQLRAVRQYAETLPDLSETRTFSEEELSYARSMLTLISLRDYQLTTLMRTSLEDLGSLQSSLYTASQNTMNGHVTQGQESAAVQSILQIIGFRTATNLLQNVALPVLNTCIRANMVIDQTATDAARQAAADAVEDVIYKQGQNIVVKGEGRITAGQIAMLSALGLISHDDFDLDMYLGGGLLTCVVMLVFILLLKRKEFEVYQNTLNTLLTCISFTLTLGLCILARLINVYLAPVALCAMLVTSLVGSRTALLCSATLSILVASLSAGGNEAFSEQMILSLVVYVGSSSLAIWLMADKSNRLRALLACLLMSIASFLLMLSYELMTSSNISSILPTTLWCVGGCVISTLLFIAIQPLLELAFNLPTPLKLLELSNPNQPLLRRLLMEASGTYHHSIIVANLAEAAAEAIGANPLLARVGGYYHDVGKLKRPLFFRENQIGNASGHDQADPEVSAAIITSHVRDGVALAKSYRLPQAVVNIVSEHHGDTPVMFFYHKAVQQAGDREINIDDFRYEGHPPTTKESAIIMICDTIEAAVRTLKNPTPEEVENFIVKLVRGKLEDGQLSDAPLTLQDIDKICTACTTVLSGVFHQRIEYPEMPNKKPRTHRPAAKPVLEQSVPEKEIEMPDAPVPEQVELHSEPEEENTVVTPSAPENTEKIQPEAIQAPLKILPVEDEAPMQKVTPPAAMPAPSLPEIEVPSVIAPVQVDTLLSVENAIQTTLDEIDSPSETDESGDNA